MYDENMSNLVNSLKDNGYRTGMLGKLHILPEESVHLDMWRKKSANFKRRKMHEYAEFELYDLKKDPHEWNNLSENPQYGHIIARLKKELHEWQVEDVVK